MKDIKISVIIPVYNVQQYLPECLKSVISQSLKEIEIIIINDGSTDDSLNICKKFARKDNRIVIIDKQNEGVWAARNDGIRNATGEYIAFLDSDDLFSNTASLENLYKAALDNNVKIVGGKRERIFLNGNIKTDDGTTKVCGVDFSADGLTQYSDFQYDYGYWCYIYNRKLLLENAIFFPPYQRFQDPPFFVKAMYTAGKFYMLNEPVYRYRIVDGDEKYTSQKTIDQLHGTIDNLVFSKQNNLPKLHFITAIRLNTECSYMASRNLESNQINEILRLLIEANSSVDYLWLDKESLPIKKPFVIDFFYDLVKTTIKYEKIRNRKIFKPIRKMLRK